LRIILDRGVDNAFIRPGKRKEKDRLD